MKKIILAACFLAMVACAGRQASNQMPDPAGSFPGDYEIQIRVWFNVNAIDPGSIRFLSIGRPYAWTADVGSVTGLQRGSQYYKCRVVVNGKNRMGGYTGPQKKDFFFKNGLIVAIGYGYTDWSDD